MGSIIARMPGRIVALGLSLLLTPSGAVDHLEENTVSLRFGNA